MNEFLAFCGFFYAHAVWSISDGSTLIAFGAKGNINQKSEMNRFVNEEHYEKSVEEAKLYLEKESDTNNFTAIYFDGYFTYPNGNKIDAIYMTARYKSENKKGEITMCLPYQKKGLLKKFKIFKPKFIGIMNFTEQEISNSYESLWNGIYSHKEGSKIWNKVIDQSK